MKILVTGGAGYVGSHCVKLLRAGDHDVIIYDNLKQGHRQAVPDDVPLVRGDLLDRKTLADVFDNFRFDAVMHFAAMLNVNESVQFPRLYYENNVLGSLNLLGEMMTHQVRKLVFSSSCAVYGIPPRLPITEDMPKNPISPYGRTKWIVEMAMHDAAANHELGSIFLRYFNACGAAIDGSIGEDHDPEYHLIPVVLEVAQKKRSKIHIFGTDYPTPDGTNVRDYIHVDDLALAHLLALDHVQEGRAVAYNVGTGKGHSVREIIESARRVTGHSIPAEESPRREGDPPELYADPAKIKTELHWQPQITEIDAIVASAWNWHKKHPNGYDE